MTATSMPKVDVDCPCCGAPVEVEYYPAEPGDCTTPPTEDNASILSGCCCMEFLHHDQDRFLDRLLPLVRDEVEEGFGVGPGLGRGLGKPLGKPYEQLSLWD